MPPMDGPMKAPRANVDVQRPEIRPYVSRLLGKPWALRRKPRISELTQAIFSKTIERRLPYEKSMQASVIVVIMKLLYCFITEA